MKQNHNDQGEVGDDGIKNVSDGIDAAGGDFIQQSNQKDDCQGEDEQPAQNADAARAADEAQNAVDCSSHNDYLQGIRKGKHAHDWSAIWAV